MRNKTKIYYLKVFSINNLLVRNNITLHRKKKTNVVHIFYKAQNNSIYLLENYGQNAM